MATYELSTTVGSNSTDANFRSWINFIHTMMTTAGWSQTADTGQINFATATAPGAANTKVGYALYEMTDTLSSTVPIIIKFAFGSASAAANPGLWFMVGTHSDGAGTLIDPNDNDRPGYLMDQYTQAAPAMAKGSSSTTARYSFGSGDGGRVVFAMFEAQPTMKDANSVGGAVAPQTQTNDWQNDDHVMLFSIERGRDWDGAVTGTHVAMLWTATTALPNRHVYFEAQHGYVLLAPLLGLAYGIGRGPGTAVTAGTLTQGNSGPPLVGGSKYETESLGVNAPASPPIHFQRNTMMMPPGINTMVSRWSRFQFSPWPPADWVNPPNPSPTLSTYVTGTTIAVSPYGTARTYRTVAGLRAPTSTVTPTTGHPTVWIYVLYE